MKPICLELLGRQRSRPPVAHCTYILRFIALPSPRHARTASNVPGLQTCVASGTFHGLSPRGACPSLNSLSGRASRRQSSAPFRFWALLPDPTSAPRDHRLFDQQLVAATGGRRSDTGRRTIRARLAIRRSKAPTPVDCRDQAISEHQDSRPFKSVVLILASREVSLTDSVQSAIGSALIKRNCTNFRARRARLRVVCRLRQRTAGSMSHWSGDSQAASAARQLRPAHWIPRGDHCDRSLRMN